MCCTGSLKLTQDFLKKNRGKKNIVVYKVLKKKQSGYDIYLHRTIIGGLFGLYNRYFEYKPGIIFGSRSKTITTNKSIDYGIHVWLTRKAAIRHLYSCGAGKKLVKLTVNPADLIGVGNFGGEKDNAVFRKVTLSQEDYKKAMRN